MNTTLTVVLVTISLATLIACTYSACRQMKAIRDELKELGEGVDQLRLTSRARVGQIATDGKPQLVRGSRTSRGRRVVVGGNKDSEQFQKLQETAHEAKTSDDDE